MEFELWYLIAVPLLFASGWWLRGLDARQRKGERNNIDDQYFKGRSEEHTSELPVTDVSRMPSSA